MSHVPISAVIVLRLIDPGIIVRDRPVVSCNDCCVFCLCFARGDRTSADRRFYSTASRLSEHESLTLECQNAPVHGVKQRLVLHVGRANVTEFHISFFLLFLLFFTTSHRFASRTDCVVCDHCSGHITRRRGRCATGIFMPACRYRLARSSIVTSEPVSTYLKPDRDLT